ncbi:MAG: hypothetical protein ABMA64_35990 [Myxococcota bacterium]
MDTAVALAAMAEGDFPHAAHHVASALASDPERPDLLALLDQLVARVGGVHPALELFPLSSGMWYGAVAVRARLLAAHDANAGLDLLCQVAAARPDAPYLRWAVGWVDRLDPDRAAMSTSRLMRIEIAPWSIASMLARRAGYRDQAHALARAAYDRFPSWKAAIALANAAKALDRWDDAVAAWTLALVHDPSDVSARLDWADNLLDRGEHAEARAKYAEALALQPGHPWAAPSAMYVDWLLSPSLDHRRALARYASANPDNRRAAWLVGSATPWVGRLPPPSEATIHNLAQLRPEHLAGKLSMAVTALESPSSQFALRRALEAHGGGLSLTVSQVQSPDPRAPFGTPRWRLWAWEGTDARPALPPPSDPRPATVLAKLAARAFRSTDWIDAGPTIARQHGLTLDAEGSEALLRAALHPGAGPEWIRSWGWAHRLLHAAAFVAAGQPGWSGTAHRDLVWSMLGTREDWAAEAAIAAGAERATRDPEVRADLLPAFEALLAQRAPGYSCTAWALAVAIDRLGGGEVEEVLREHEDPEV